MNRRALKKNLPKGWKTERDKSGINIRAADGTVFHVAPGSGWEALELAQYLASKIPVQIKT